MTDPTSPPVPEDLWAGEFGDAYVQRNAVLDERRHVFWAGIHTDLALDSVLEVGCGQGANLAPLAQLLGPARVWGVDINRASLARAAVNAPGVNLAEGSARSLPFDDRRFDLVFTVGVLIHQPPEYLPQVLDEIVRTSRRYVLAAEYHADEPVELEYRGKRGALFKRDYRQIFTERFPELTLLRTGFLDRDAGFDRVTYALFERAP